MTAAVAEIRGETAYDALRDGLSLVVRVLSRPCTLEELAAEEQGLDRAQLVARLNRLVRAGVLRLAGDRYEAAARLVHTDRQEGMVTFLSQYMLPHFARLAREPDWGFVAQLDLHLTAEEQQGLRRGLVQDLLNDLTALSEEPAEVTQGGIFLCLGTSDVPPAGEAADRLLETVRRSARQRATPSDAARAVLTYADGRYGLPSLQQAKELVRKAAERLGPKLAGERKANYTLVLGFCVRDSANGAAV